MVNSKRLFDLALVLPGLAVLAPLLGLIALWVRFDSSGPALFKQVRIGRFGRPFQVYKFRTMVVGAPRLGPELTMGEDRRITRAGRFLRRHRLDELPQLLNVLKGEMSLVGPRPEVPRYVACYPENLRNLVLSLAPGITSRAAIHFLDEGTLLGAATDPEKTYLEQILPVKLQAYAEYAADHTVGGDLLIIFRTLTAIFL